MQVCIVGKSYGPDFYKWIKHTDTRKKFELLARETEEDYQSLIRLLEKFNVKIFRPDISENLDELFIENKWVQPPTAPREYFIMIQDNLWVPFVPNRSHAWCTFYRQNKNPNWPDFVLPNDFVDSVFYSQEFMSRFRRFGEVDQKHLDAKLNFYKNIFEGIRQQGNQIKHTDLDFINGCFVSRIGTDLYFGTQTYHDNKEEILEIVNKNFSSTRNRIVDSAGHGDAVYCPITPGLIISTQDVATYADTFPDWEVVYLAPSNYSHMDKFQASMKHNKGRWFMPDFEKNQDLIDTVNYYFDEWIGNVAETVFNVNILIINPKNIVVSSYDKKVEAACKRHGIEMHLVPFRHRYFWDCGIHCATNDLHRIGTPQNFFD